MLGPKTHGKEAWMGESRASGQDRYSTEAIAARHAQVVGEAPRVGPLAQEELVGEARQLCVAVREAIGIKVHDDIPEYMRTMVKNPGIFACHMEMGQALFTGTISPRDRELAVLCVGWLCRAPYEWSQHVDIAQRYGVSAEEVARIPEGSTAPGWSGHDAAILRGVEELIADAAISQATWDVLAQGWDEAQLLEFPMMVGQYVATAYVQNSIRARLTGGRPGLNHR
jgi:alkylhydroperoxidase family enzyme